MSATTGRQAPPRADTHRLAWTGLASVFRAMLDAIALIVILELAETIFFGPGFYAGMDFHPFWLVVLLTTLQNGLFAGVVATVFATFALEWPTRQIGVDIVEHYIQVSSLPLQWLLTALLLGLFRGAELRDQDRLKTALKSANQDKRTLAEELKLADAALNQVEMEVLTQSGLSPNLVARTLSELGSYRLDENLEDAFNAACRLLAPSPCLLVMSVDDRLTAVAGDRTARDLFARDAHWNTALADVVENSTPSVLDSADVKSGTHGCLAVSPFHDETGHDETGGTRGAVVILAEDCSTATQAMLPASILAGIVKHRFQFGQSS